MFEFPWLWGNTSVITDTCLPTETVMTSLTKKKDIRFFKEQILLGKIITAIYRGHVKGHCHVENRLGNKQGLQGILDPHRCLVKGC
jgi:hypothetical protein